MPACGTQFAVPGQSGVKGAACGLAKRVKEELAGVVKSSVEVEDPVCAVGRESHE